MYAIKSKKQTGHANANFHNNQQYEFEHQTFVIYQPVPTINKGTFNDYAYKMNHRIQLELSYNMYEHKAANISGIEATRSQQHSINSSNF